MFLFILVFVLTSVTQAVAQTELVPVPEPVSNTQAIQDVPNNIEKSALPAATAEMEALRELDQTAYHRDGDGGVIQHRLLAHRQCSAH